MRSIKSHICIIVCIICSSCANDSYTDLVEIDTSINLKWNKAYEEDSIEKAVIGLKWSLSYIGATILSNNEGIKISDSLINIDINSLGFDAHAKSKLIILSNKIKNSEEYKVTGTIDLGRYVSLLIGASEHYYQFVNMPNNLDNILKNYTLLPEKGYVNNSGISLKHRIIGFSDQEGLNQFFISEEVDSLTGFIYEYETIELMANGQLRFGIFDANGIRMNGANPSHTNAGKPAKCIWCHESGINPLFKPQRNFPDFLTADELQQRLLSYRTSHNELKSTLVNGVDYTKTQEHTLTELLYISFMEPSAERLALEWNLPFEAVQEKLKNLDTHMHEEFPFLGNLYYRKEVETYATFLSVEYPETIRETSPNKINLLN